MRGKTIRGAWLLAACMALAPAGVRGQNVGNPVPEYAPADPQLPIPLGSTRPEDGGLFLFSDFMFFRWNNPLREQAVAVRGFQVSDGSNPAFTPGQFIGSHAAALDVNQLTGQDSYQAGFRVGAGWKFGDGAAVTFSYFRLTETSFRAGATEAPPGGVSGDLADSFLFAPVFNFPPQFAGAQNKVFVPVTSTVGTTNPTAPANAVSSQFAFGAWNGASVMTESYLMRFQQWDITLREPFYDTEDLRLNGLVGVRHDWIWDRYQWRSTTYSDDGLGNLSATPDDIAEYTNIVSNSMWGVHAGCQMECYLGHGFAAMAEGRASLLMDAIHEIAAYDTLDKFAAQAENKRSKRLWNVVPEVEGRVSLMWFPWEAIQVQVGYQVMAYFNTISSPRPIDFDYTNLAPHYSTTSRFFDGFTAGLGITF